MTLVFRSGQMLFENGSLALHENCCCGGLGFCEGQCDCHPTQIEVTINGGPLCPYNGLSILCDHDPFDPCTWKGFIPFPFDDLVTVSVLCNEDNELPVLIEVHIDSEPDEVWADRFPTDPESWADYCCNPASTLPYINQAIGVCHESSATIVVTDPSCSEVDGAPLAATHDIELTASGLFADEGQPDLNQSFMLDGGATLDDKSRSYTISAAELSEETNDYYGWHLSFEPESNLVVVDMRRSVVTETGGTYEHTIARFQANQLAELAAGQGVYLQSPVTPPNPENKMRPHLSTIYLRAYPK